MRVCIVTPTEIGATETFIRAHVENLQHDVISLHGYWLDYSWKGRTLREWRGDDHKEHGRWLNLLPRFIEFRLRRRFFPLISDFEIAHDFLKLQKVDVVLAEYGTAAAFITPVCQAASIPLVAHFHGFDASRYKTLEDFEDSYRQMFSFASSIISVSHKMSAKLIELGCPSEKICYNPYGPDPRFFDIRPDYSSRTLIAVGRHTAKKAPYLTLEAFRRALTTCPELRLCMIGDGELLEVSERLSVAWGLEGRVEFLGLADRSMIEKRLSAAFAFVQHSIQAKSGDAEGMPVAILEAAAAGLPIISTRHAGIPEAVIDEVTGFIVEPGNTRCMAERIVLLASDRQLAERLGTEGRKHVAANFSMDQHISRLTQILGCARQFASGNNAIAGCAIGG